MIRNNQNKDGEKTVSINKRKMTSRDWALLSMAMLSVVFLFFFAYLPMFGVVLAFKEGDYKLNILHAITNANWCGLNNFKEFLSDPNFTRVIFNTLIINLLLLAINFPIPIIFALLLNEVKMKNYKKIIQTIGNLPHFISWVIFGGIIVALTDQSTGIFNPLLEMIGLSSKENPVNLMDAEYFRLIVIFAQIIKGTGWGSIVYLSAIAGLDSALYEAAMIDGATRLQRMRFITLPSIAPTITVFLLLNISRLLSNSFDEFYSLQNVNNIEVSEVIATYSYKTGISQRRYSYASALGLFNSVISITLLLSANWISKKLTDRGIFG